METGLYEEGESLEAYPSPANLIYGLIIGIYIGKLILWPGSVKRKKRINLHIPLTRVQMRINGNWGI